MKLEHRLAVLFFFCTSLYVNRMESLCHFQFYMKIGRASLFLNWTESFCRIHFFRMENGTEGAFTECLCGVCSISNSRIQGGRDMVEMNLDLLLLCLLLFLPGFTFFFGNGPNFPAVSISHTKNGMEQSALCDLDRFFCRFHFSI
jgi:hypothetical protein